MMRPPDGAKQGQDLDLRRPRLSRAGASEIAACQARRRRRNWTATNDARESRAVPKGYGQFCPVAKAAELFAERWTPLVLRELCRGSSQFNEIHSGVPLMSRTLLAQRLKELTAAGVVEALPKEAGRGYAYRLTTAGLAFCPLIDALGDWGALWARNQISREDCDPGFLMWALRGYADRRSLPETRLVVRFEFSGLPERRPVPQAWWLIAEEGELDVCWEEPGFEVDVHVTADLPRFVRVWRGYEGLREAVRDGDIAFEGPQTLVSAVRRILDLRDRPAPKPIRFRPAPATGDAAADVRAEAGA